MHEINKKDKNLNKMRLTATVIFPHRDFSDDYWLKPTIS